MTKCILVVDDDPSIRELVVACLEDLGGWRTLSAQSGFEGLIQVNAHPLDAVLLDISMPDMDGFGFYAQLKANPQTQGLPIILLTAKVLASDRHRFSQMDIAGMIAKPFNPTTLCDQIAALLAWPL